MSAPVIVINGPSSSGKTTLARALQAALDGPWLICGLDAFLDMLPARYYQPPLWASLLGRLDAGGPAADQLVRGMHQAIAALSRAGCPVIADHVLLHRDWAEDLRATLRGLPMVSIGLTCPDALLAERERLRGDRAIGAALAQASRVHGHLSYDLSFDTGHVPVEACVARVRVRLSVQRGG